MVMNHFPFMTRLIQFGLMKMQENKQFQCEFKNDMNEMNSLIEKCRLNEKKEIEESEKTKDKMNVDNISSSIKFTELPDVLLTEIMSYLDLYNLVLGPLGVNRQFYNVMASSTIYPVEIRVPAQHNYESCWFKKYCFLNNGFAGKPCVKLLQCVSLLQRIKKIDIKFDSFWTIISKFFCYDDYGPSIFNKDCFGVALAYMLKDIKTIRLTQSKLWSQSQEIPRKTISYLLDNWQPTNLILNISKIPTQLQNWNDLINLISDLKLLEKLSIKRFEHYPTESSPASRMSIQQINDIKRSSWIHLEKLKKLEIRDCCHSLMIQLIKIIPPKQLTHLILKAKDSLYIFDEICEIDVKRKLFTEIRELSLKNIIFNQNKKNNGFIQLLFQQMHELRKFCFHSKTQQEAIDFINFIRESVKNCKKLRYIGIGGDAITLNDTLNDAILKLMNEVKQFNQMFMLEFLVIYVGNIFLKNAIKFMPILTKKMNEYFKEWCISCIYDWEKDDNYKVFPIISKKDEFIIYDDTGCKITNNYDEELRWFTIISHKNMNMNQNDFKPEIPLWY